MAEKDVVITYETLFELLRIEKNREDLQKLSPTFFDEVLIYLNDKRRTFESKQSQETLFVSDEKEKTRLEIDNIKKILKDLYDKREKKIVSTAIGKARTGVTLINTASMLPPERAMFEMLTSTLLDYRKNVLLKLVNGSMPEMATSMVSFQEPEVPQEQSTDDDTGGMSFRRADEPKELKSPPISAESGVAGKRVRFLAPIEEIVGPDLQIYGPFDKGAVISLPNELARVLAERNQVEMVID